MHIHTGNTLADICIGATVMFCFAIFLIIRGTTAKEDFNKSTGKIVHLGITYKHLSHRHGNEIRYLLIDSYRYPFEIFIGHDKWDFSPKYENLDSLSLGDTVTVYHDEQDGINEEGINRLTQFIDRNGEPFYIKGTLDIKFGLFFMFFSFALALLGFYLYRTGKLKL